MSAKNNKMLFAACLLGLACFILPSATKADTVTFIGAGPNQANGVYVVPYQLQVSSINGGATINVICDDYTDEVHNGEAPWTASIETVADITGALFATQANAQENYEKAAFLYYQYQLNPTAANAAADNFAIWDLFDNAVGANAVTGEQTALTAAATWYADGATGLNFSQFLIITPTSWSNDPNQPQEYIYDPTPTPEPGSLALFGSGLLGLATLLRRKLVSNS
jgi:hypothetical protein